MKSFTVLCIFVFSFLYADTALSSKCPTEVPKLEKITAPEIEKGFYSSTTVKIVIDKSPKEVEVWFDSVAPETIIHGTQKVAGISGTKAIGDKDWGLNDSLRLVCYKDDNSSIEKVLENTPGDLFSYQMWDFSRDITHAIKYAVSEFKIKPISNDQSVLEWTFSFRPNAYIFRFPLNRYLNNDFKEYMEKTLDDIKVFLESGNS